MKKYRNMNDKGMEYLAASIIKQAAIDYWHDCDPKPIQRPKGMNDEEFAKYRKDVELYRKRRKSEEHKFFRSAWFRTLLQTDRIDGNMMIRQIEDMRRNNKRIVFAEFSGDDSISEENSVA